MTFCSKPTILECVTSAISNQNTAGAPRVPALNRPNMVSVGTMAFLAQELMFFAGLFAMWFTARANGQSGDWNEQTEHLNWWFALIITIVLVTSSVTSQFGVFAAERGDVYKLRMWYLATIGLGVVFLCLQMYEYTELILHGVTIPSSVFASVFYILTGFHALHVLAGVIAFVIVLLRVTKAKFTPAQATAAMAVSYYWHFVDVVWIGLFFVVYVIQ
ncbi:cytochrome c oxidase subunit III [Corynebacterium renale]|uniref:Cytochrome c oxidase subunit 3 n=1 Tax=Corynebacterium renale TaxID=1724 RepID=A0A2A9DQX4_9CORY|nr:cytochrome c oxidase subunit 3 [Corynebacterium renale]SQG65036.1 cytochrome c oxidase subunit III [Corynebacterium renale]SQI18886.1 cytochrome c oxidase subunit III [Corynebacterium renale]STC97212.1 cytochrome c oxidase subunit III [Corynebacterium renale]